MTSVPPRPTPPSPGMPAPAVLPAAQLLGVTAPGPFAILGLTTEDLTQEKIIRALEARLSQLAAHPHGYTPAADELRLALHAAAAQLLDEGVRRHLVSVWRTTQPTPLIAGIDAPQAAPPAQQPPREAASPLGSHADPAASLTQPPTQPPTESQPSPWAPSPRSSRDSNSLDPAMQLDLERDITMAVALSGGWNDHTLRHLAMLAHARGVSSSELLNLLTRFMRRPALLSAGTTAPGRAGGIVPASPLPSRPGRFLDEPSPPDEQIDPGARFVKAALIIGGVAIVSLTAMFILIAVLILPKPAPPTPPVSAADAEAASSRAAAAARTTPRDAIFRTDASNTTTSTTPAATSASIQERTPADVLLRDAQRTIDQFAADESGSLSRFAAIAQAAGTQWSSWEPDFRIAMLSTHVDLALRASSAEEAALIDAIAPGLSRLVEPGTLLPEEIERVIWSAGVLARVLGESELSATRLRSIKAALARALQSNAPPSPGFDLGAFGAINTVRDRMIAALPSTPGDAQSEVPASVPADTAFTPQHWERWIACVDALTKGRDGPRAELLITALDQMLKRPGDLTADREGSASARALVSALSWRTGDPARRALLAWFDDRSITNADLSIVTGQLTKMNAPGVGYMMALSSKAGELDRAEMREQYATAWGLRESEVREAAIDAWTTALAAQLADSTPQSPTSSPQPGPLGLASAIRAARLSLAAQALMRGDMDVAMTRASEVPLGLESAAQRLARTREPSRTATRAVAGEWSIQYLAAANNTESRLKLLEQLRTAASPPDEIEAELLAVDAVRGSPVQVRNAARAVVDRFSAAPTIINALLDVAPQIPATPENAKLLSAVTLADVPLGKDRGSWSLSVRRALVQRMLDVLAGAGDAGVIDELSTLYAEALAQSLNDGASASSSASPGSASTAWPNPSPDADTSARLLVEDWKRQAARLAPSGREPVRADEIDRRWKSRANLSRGPVQRTVAHRLATAEFMAYVIVAERSSRRDAVLAVLDELSTSRRSAQHVFTQLAAAERAILRLWSIRLDLESNAESPSAPSTPTPSSPAQSTPTTPPSDPPQPNPPQPNPPQPNAPTMQP